MKRIYDGLKVGAATRPKYVFQGKDRDWYRKNHPHKATKSVFIMTSLGLRYMPIIMGGAPDTYYMRADGTAASKEAAGGPETDASACMTIATVNAETLAAADLLYMADNGGVYRDQLTVPSPGSGGSPITFQKIAGQNPVINGSVLITTWSDEGSNVWSASRTGTPAKVFFDGTQGTEEVSQAAVNATNEWFHDSGTNTLYVYSTSAPDTAFTDPGIEATNETYCIQINNKAFITIDGIDCTKSADDCIQSVNTSPNTIIKNLTLSYAGDGHGYLCANASSNCTVQNVTAFGNGTTSGHHGLYMGNNTTDQGAWLIEDCIAYSNFAYGFHNWDCRSGTVRRCLAYDNPGAGFLAGDCDDNADVNFEYCISHDNKYGFECSSIGNTYNGVTTVKIYNCVAYNCELFSGPFGVVNCADADTTIETRNNIWFQDSYAMEIVGTTGAVLDFNYNCYWSTSGNMINWGDKYTQAQFATYQSDKSQDANSISADPLFLDAAGNDYHLKSNSFCIDIGIDVSLEEDFDGVAVPQGSAPDIGAYEFEQEAPGPSPGPVVILGATSTPSVSLSENTEIDEFWEGYFQDIEKAQQS